MSLREELIGLTRELIDIPSTTGEELAIGEHLDTLLSREGFVCERQQVSDDRFNLWAGTNGAPRVVLCTHIDTVPPFSGSSERDGRIYGRGSCDTKGALAAMILAARRLLDDGVTDFAILLVVGEETDSIGARVANDRFAGRGSEYVVVAEPTESRFVSGSKGTLTAKLAFSGAAAHSAHPEQGDSAILKMARAIDRIDREDWGRSEDFGETTVNVGVARGGVKPNVVPADAEIEMIFRLATTPESVRTRLEKLATEFDARLDARPGVAPIRMLVPDNGDGPVVAFGTDLPYLTALGTPLLFGPGSIHDAHTANESVAIDEIFNAVETYRSLVVELLEREAP